MAQPMMHLLVADKIYRKFSSIHLLSDMIWYHSVRVPFKEAFLKAPLQNMTMNEAYYADCEQIEHLMFSEENASHIIDAIKGSNAY